MLGLLPVNAEPVNGPGFVAVWHVASASIAAAAQVEEADAVRRKVARTGVLQARAIAVSSPRKDKYMAGALLARAIPRKVQGDRGRAASAAWQARAIRNTAQLSVGRTIGMVPLLARAFVSPVPMLINANYLIAFAVMQCRALVTARPNAVRNARSRFNVASALFRKAAISGRRVARLSLRPSASLTRKQGIRTRILSAVFATDRKSVV